MGFEPMIFGVTGRRPLQAGPRGRSIVVVVWRIHFPGFLSLVGGHAAMAVGTSSVPQNSAETMLMFSMSTCAASDGVAACALFKAAPATGASGRWLPPQSWRAPGRSTCRAHATPSPSSCRRPPFTHQRRGRDSNSRAVLPATRLASARLQPLGHLSRYFIALVEEKKGFEPPVDLRPRRFSKPEPSPAQPLLQVRPVTSRREWDSNPRHLSVLTFSKRAPSA